MPTSVQSSKAVERGTSDSPSARVRRRDIAPTAASNITRSGRGNAVMLVDLLRYPAMPLLHGKDISAAEIEDELGRWTAEPFARLCNAVVSTRAPDLVPGRQAPGIWRRRPHARLRRFLAATPLPASDFPGHHSSADTLHFTCISSCRTSGRTCSSFRVEEADQPGCSPIPLTARVGSMAERCH